jgi:hypothetical protein
MSILAIHKPKKNLLEGPLQATSHGTRSCLFKSIMNSLAASLQAPPHGNRSCLYWQYINRRKKKKNNKTTTKTLGGALSDSVIWLEELPVLAYDKSRMNNLEGVLAGSATWQQELPERLQRLGRRLQLRHGPVSLHRG